MIPALVVAEGNTNIATVELLRRYQCIKVVNAHKNNE
jgi:hypothetical protein